VWYTGDDEELFKENARRDVSVLKQLQRGQSPEGCSLHPDDLCTVGLEKYLVSPEYIMKRARSKRLVIHVVLAEQARGSGAERVDFAVMRLSKWSVEQANKIGAIQLRERRER